MQAVGDKQHQQIDRYIIRRVLGTGAMGSVYAAWDPKLCREVALKVVPSRLSGESKGRERFQREARAIAAVRHPNIVEIYDYSGTDSEYLYLVIEKLDGEDLYATLHRRGLMAEAVAAAVGHELCLALQVAHDAGIIHRDLKPENVFLNASGRVVLTDFGIVKAVRGDSAVDGYRENTDVIGTPGFMAPELMNGRGLGPPIDIFALGALLYNITTNRLPFEGPTPLAIFQAATAGKYDDPRKHNPQLSEELCAIIASCLHPNPRKRPRSAEMVRLALKTVLEDNGVTDVRDDLHDFMHNTESYKQRAHARAVKHLVQQIKVSLKDHDEALLRRLRKRLLVLDPYNEDLRDVSGVMDVVNSSPRGLRALTDLGSRVNKFMSTHMQRFSAPPPRWMYAVGAVVLFTCVAVGVGLWEQPSHPMATGALANATRVWPRGMEGSARPGASRTTTPGDAYPMPNASPTHGLASIPAEMGSPNGAVQPNAVASGGTYASSVAAGNGDAVAQGLHGNGVAAAGNGNVTPPAPAEPPRGPGARPAVRAAWVEVRVLGGGANLVVDGQALGRAAHKSVQMVPGRHVVEVMRRGRHLRRVITLTNGDRVALRVDLKHQKMNVQ